MSPSVLRYAVPALALFAVITVGLVMLRQQSRSEYVARNEPLQPALNTAEEQPVAKGDAKSSTGMFTAQEKVQEKAQDSPVADADKRLDREEAVAPTSAAPGAPVAADSVTVAPQKDAQTGQVAAAEQPNFAPEPKAAPHPKPETPPAEVAGEVARRNEKQAERDGRGQEREGERAKSEDRENNQALAKARGSSPARGSISSLRTPSVGTADARKADDESGTRTVSGRRFRRQGDVWVDTAYQGSVSLITVGRGTEQYRALIADEPGIRIIAEQLSGEIILVWKARAYRIR